MMSPLVSVVVPSYNHEKFLKERLDSILNQTFQDFELIILDDLSPDSSREIIETYRAHPKVSKIVYNEKNSGSTFFQWNKAIFELAKGELIWIAESDDVAESNFLETLVPILKKNPEIVLAYCQSARMDSEGNITGSWLSHTNTLINSDKFNQSFNMNGSEYIENYLIYKNTIPNASAVIFRRAAFIKTNGAKTDLKTNGDWDLWVKIVSQGNLYYERSELNFFRYHNSSVIAKANEGNTGKIELKTKLYGYDLDMRKSISDFFKKNHMLKNKKSIRINKKIIAKNKIYIFFLVLIKRLLRIKS